MPPAPRIAPSILSADFARLGDQVAEVVGAGATVIHVDVMDGRFVPPITMGPIVVDALRSRFGDAIDLDVHLMIAEPERQVEAFAQAGATGITLHAEATDHAHRALDLVREHGAVAQVAGAAEVVVDGVELHAGRAHDLQRLGDDLRTDPVAPDDSDLVTHRCSLARTEKPPTSGWTVRQRTPVADVRYTMMITA